MIKKRPFCRVFGWLDLYSCGSTGHWLGLAQTFSSIRNLFQNQKEAFCCYMQMVCGAWAQCTPFFSPEVKIAYASILQSPSPNLLRKWQQTGRSLLCVMENARMGRLSCWMTRVEGTTSYSIVYAENPGCPGSHSIGWRPMNRKASCS